MIMRKLYHIVKASLVLVNKNITVFFKNYFSFKHIFITMFANKFMKSNLNSFFFLIDFGFTELILRKYQGEQRNYNCHA